MCAIDLFSKYVWIVPLKDKRGISIVNVSKGRKPNKKVSKGRKPNKLWIDQGSEFYNNLFKRILKMNKNQIIQHTMKGNLLLLKELLGP